MKTNQPIKRHEALVAFSKDHHFGLLLAWKIRQGFAMKVEAERISRYVLFSFEEDLRHHFREEEQLMFSKLPPGDPLRVQAEEEHGRLYHIVAQLRQDSTSTGLLTEFADTLEAHIRFEERSLFNHLQDNLDASELAKISSYGGQEAGNVDAHWQDIFWVKDKNKTA